MTSIKTYTAIIKITFETHDKENPRAIVKNMASCFNNMRGANLHTYGEIEKLIEETNNKKILIRSRV